MTNTPSIERLKELLAKALRGATSGPWSYEEDREDSSMGWIIGPDKTPASYLHSLQGDTLFDVCGDSGEQAINAELVVFLRNNAETILATLETLTPSAGEVERLTEAGHRLNNALGTLIIASDKDERLHSYREDGLAAMAEFEATLASPPLPHPDIEGRARELLAAEYDLDVAEHEGKGYKNAADNQRQKAADIRKGAAELHAIRAIVKALSLPTTEIRREALEEAARVADAYNWYGFNGGAVTIAKEAGAAIATGIRSLASKEAGRL